MRKKVIVLALVIVIAISFAACKKGNEAPTTTLSETMPIATTANQALNNSSPEVATMILTSAVGETMPTVVTTAFNLSKEISTDPLFQFTTGEIVPPIPDTTHITSPVITTQGVTNPSNATEPNEQTEPTEKTTNPEATTVPDNQKKYINADIYDLNINRKKNCVYDIVAADWKDYGGIKSNSTDLIIVELNGKQKAVRGSISGIADGAGNYTLTVQTGDLNIKDGDVLNIRIPPNFMVSRDGTHFSEEINSTITYDESMFAAESDAD